MFDQERFYALGVGLSIATYTKEWLELCYDLAVSMPSASG